MSVKPEITVVVPSYNRPELLVECLKSVLAQEDVDWECIVSDDGSTEDTLSVMPDDGRFHYIAGEHSGHTSVVINRGIRQARGDYITVLADDDMLTPDSLKYRLEAFGERDGTIFVCGSAAVVGGRMPYEYARDMLEAQSLPVYYRSIKNIERPWISVQGCSVLVHRAVLEKYGIYDEHPDLRFGQDRELWARWCMQGVMPLHCGKVVTFWRQHPGQKTWSKTLEERERKNMYRDHILKVRAEGVTPENTPMLPARSLANGYV